MLVLCDAMVWFLQDRIAILHHHASAACLSKEHTAQRTPQHDGLAMQPGPLIMLSDADEYLSVR